MKAISDEACAAWCVANGLVIDETATNRGLLSVPSSGDYREVRGNTPASAGKLLHLMRVFAAAILNQGEVLVWIREWSVWPSSEHLPLFQSLREAMGVRESLSQKPGMLFGVEEREAFISVAFTAILFLWDVYLVAADGRALLLASHNEYITVKAPSDVDELVDVAWW